MVTLFAAAFSALAAVEARRPLIERLDPRTRVSALSALLGILLLGILLVMMIALGGRFVRRFIRRPPRSVPPINGAARDGRSD